MFFAIQPNPAMVVGQNVGQMSWAETKVKSGKHPDKVLSAVRVNKITASGRYADGNGLYLVVDPSGAKRWLLRTVVQGRRRDIGLGGLSLVPLAEAREKAQAYRKVAREGGDPIALRNATQIVVPTFRAAAEVVHAEHERTWKNPKHAAQWINTLRTYAFPIIGDTRVDAIDTPAVLRVLAPIWLVKAETARRVRQRIGTVLDWAKASGFRTGDNPVEGVSRGLPRQVERVRHHAAMPYAEVPKFITTLRNCDSNMISKLAFEFLILTACRTSEVLLARWDEVDLDGKLWTVPAERMKASRNHRVPLPPRVIEILTEAQEIAAGSELVFPGRSTDKPLSNMVFLKILERLKAKVTAHGFRSAFRDWAAECTAYPRDTAEMALAHAVENKVEAAYRRGDQLEKRRQLMGDWATYLAQSPNGTADG
jgi:integrase